MVIKTKTSMALMIAIAMSGCGNDISDLQRGDGMVAVGVSDVLSAGTDIAISRASSTNFPDGAKMGVFRMAGSGYDAQDNVEFTYSSSTGKWANTSDPILVGIQATALCAYYPFNSATFNGTTASLKAQKYEPGKDLSYAINSETPVNNANPDATFAMKHAYARIKMSISRHSNYTGNCNVTSVNIADLTKFFDERTLDITTGEYGGSIKQGGWTYNLNTGNIGVGDTNSAYDVLVPPQEVSNSLKVTLQVDGMSRWVNCHGSYFKYYLTAGSQYEISLVITETGVSIKGNVNVTDWVTDTSYIGDGMTVIPSGPGISLTVDEINLGGSACTAADKKLLASVFFAEGNLKSSDNTLPYEWTTPTDYGYYYPWNSSYTGTNKANNIDPCDILNGTKYGIGWWTPSSLYFEALRRCTDKKMVEYNGVKGMWFMNKTKGLFLPAGGHTAKEAGSGTYGTSYVGEWGYYWSGMPFLDGNNRYTMNFGPGWVNVNQTDKRHGMLIRCIRKKE